MLKVTKKVETARAGGYRRNRRHLLRTEESQILEITPTPDVSNDEDLTDTKVEPSSFYGYYHAVWSDSGREPQRLKDYVKY